MLCLSWLLAACAAPGTLPARTIVPTSASSTPRPTIVPPPVEPTAIPASATIAPSLTVAPSPMPTGGEFTLALEPVVESGLVRPDYLTHAGDDRLIVVEQPGRIRIIENGQLLDQPF